MRFARTALALLINDDGEVQMIQRWAGSPSIGVFGSRSQPGGFVAGRLHRVRASDKSESSVSSTLGVATDTSTTESTSRAGHASPRAVLIY